MLLSILLPHYSFGVENHNILAFAYTFFAPSSLLGDGALEIGNYHLFGQGRYTHRLDSSRYSDGLTQSLQYVDRFLYT